MATIADDEAAGKPENFPAGSKHFPIQANVHKGEDAHAPQPAA